MSHYTIDPIDPKESLPTTNDDARRILARELAAQFAKTFRVRLSRMEKGKAVPFANITIHHAEDESDVPAATLKSDGSTETANAEVVDEIVAKIFDYADAHASQHGAARYHAVGVPERAGGKPTFEAVTWLAGGGLLPSELEGDRLGEANAMLTVMTRAADNAFRHADRALARSGASLEIGAKALKDSAEVVAKGVAMMNEAGKPVVEMARLKLDLRKIEIEAAEDEREDRDHMAMFMRAASLIQGIWKDADKAKGKRAGSTTPPTSSAPTEAAASPSSSAASPTQSASVIDTTATDVERSESATRLHDMLEGFEAEKRAELEKMLTARELEAVRHAELAPTEDEWHKRFGAVYDLIVERGRDGASQFFSNLARVVGSDGLEFMALLTEHQEASGRKA